MKPISNFTGCTPEQEFVIKALWRVAKSRERCRRTYKNNPKKAIEKTRRWQKNNPEKANEKTRRWQKNNPERVRENVRRYALSENGRDNKKLNFQATGSLNNG